MDPNGEAAGLAFLAQNATAAGVVTLPSGMQYKVLTEGGGLKHPTVSCPCECHYAGRLLDGTEFDSSYKRGKPSTFAPNQVIKGWTEAMQLMVQGDKWEMYIPYALAYGANGKAPTIPAKAMLIFIMEIVKIKGDSTPMVTFPVWSDKDLGLWTEKDEVACQEWRETKVQKYHEGDEKLVQKFATVPELDAWLDLQRRAASKKMETPRRETQPREAAIGAAFSATERAIAGQTRRRGGAGLGRTSNPREEPDV